LAIFWEDAQMASFIGEGFGRALLPMARLFRFLGISQNSPSFKKACF
jgi:hypothetical protein